MSNELTSQWFAHNGKWKACIEHWTGPDGTWWSASLTHGPGIHYFNALCSFCPGLFIVSPEMLFRRLFITFNLKWFFFFLILRPENPPPPFCGNPFPPTLSQVVMGAEMMIGLADRISWLSGCSSDTSVGRIWAVDSSVTFPKESTQNMKKIIFAFICGVNDPVITLEFQISSQVFQKIMAL